jgi:integrase
LVFGGENGQRFLSPTVVLRRQPYPAMVAAEVRRVGPTQEKRTFHSFRHTFAKRALESGAQITWLSRHLGHSSLKVTTDISATGNGRNGSSRRRRWRAPSLSS